MGFLGKWLYNLVHKQCINERLEVEEELKNTEDELEQFEQAYKILQEQVIKQETEKERYYNNKYPKQDINYRGRPLIGSTSNVTIDVRNFIMPFDANTKIIADKLTGESDDAKALEGLKWVRKNFKYVSDKTSVGMNEFWQFPYESLKTKKGDCEDGAILLHNILLQAGVPYWKLRLSAGWVQSGTKKEGHAYLTYFCESQDKWVILDWCYWPNNLEIVDRKDYKEEEKYLDVWFSWNMKYCYSTGLNTHASKLLR